MLVIVREPFAVFDLCKKCSAGFEEGKRKGILGDEYISMSDMAKQLETSVDYLQRGLDKLVLCNVLTKKDVICGATGEEGN